MFCSRALPYLSCLNQSLSATIPVPDTNNTSNRCHDGGLTGVADKAGWTESWEQV